MPKTEFMLSTYKHTQNHRELIFVVPLFITRLQHLTQDPVPDIQLQDTCFVFWGLVFHSFVTFAIIQVRTTFWNSKLLLS